MAAILEGPADRTPSAARQRLIPRLCRKLYVQVLIAILLAAVFGYFFPHQAVQFKPLGDVFLKAIRMIVTPIIFTTVVVGIAAVGDLRKIMIVGAKALIYFEIATTLALLLGLAVGNIWPIGRGINANPATLDAHAVAEYATKAKGLTIPDFLVGIVPNTFFEPFVTGDILPVLFVAVLFGLALCHFQQRSRPIVQLIDDISGVLFKMVGYIMRFAPIGAFGAMAFTVGKYGLSTLMQLGQLVFAVYVVSFLFILLLGVALRVAGFSLLKVLNYFKDEILFVFAATSAETMIPRSMEKLEKLGVTREVVGMVMPAAFSFNMAGTAIYMTMAVLFMANATNVHLTALQQFEILFVMLFTSKGAAGVTGGGFVALAATMPAIGAVPVAALTLIIGVDRFMAEIRAASNLTGNIIATLVVARWVKAIAPEQAQDIAARQIVRLEVSEAKGPAPAASPIAQVVDQVVV